jgi:hypothetical protein
MPWAELFSPASLPADKDGGVPEAGPSDSGPVDSGSPIPPAAPARSPHPPLYRTGTLTCATDTTQDLKCPVVGYDLEDGDFQPNAHSFSATADEVTDAVTGLVWQRAADGTTYDNATAIKHCAALSSTEAKAGSFRLPSVVELMTLIDYGRDLPSVDPSFKGIQPTNYWTSTSVLGTQKLAWTVKLDFGEVLPLLDTSALPAVCVRGQSTVLNVASGTVRKAGALTVQGETVVDATGGLEWQRQDDGVKRSWQDSLAYCSALSLAGKSGWHLANVGELSSIVEFDKAPSGVNLDPAFQDGKADIYWTSSQNEGAPTLSWSITFNLGVIDGVTYTGLAYARCVRHTAEPNQEPDAGPGADAGSDASPADAGPSVSASGGGGGCGCEIGPARADGQLTGAFGVVTAILGLAWARQRGRRVELHATGEVRDA